MGKKRTINIQTRKDKNIQTMIYHLYLINDKEKTFHYVYATLMEVLEHELHQAEQCWIIAKSVGKAHIKQGEYMELIKFQNALMERGLEVEIKKEMI